MHSVNNENLIQHVIDHSEANTWKEAVKEWCITDCEEDDEQTSSCICGQERLKYLFTIQNSINNNVLYPIGSTCIKKFERKDLNVVTTTKIGLYRLRKAVEHNSYISLSNEYFSRRILLHLFEAGAFKANEYNNYNPSTDYKFLLRMFNKRNKDEISGKQQGRVNAIILFSIKPFLQSTLKRKRTEH